MSSQCGRIVKAPGNAVLLRASSAKTGRTAMKLVQGDTRGRRWGPTALNEGSDGTRGGPRGPDEAR